MYECVVRGLWYRSNTVFNAFSLMLRSRQTGEEWPFLDTTATRALLDRSTRLEKIL